MNDIRQPIKFPRKSGPPVPIPLLRTPASPPKNVKRPAPPKALPVITPVAKGAGIKPFPRPKPPPLGGAGPRPLLCPPGAAARPHMFRSPPRQQQQRKKKGLPMFVSKRYDLIAEIGSGGMGSIYKAKDRLLDITVALKFLPRAFTLQAGAVESFKNEAKLAMLLSHKSIARLYNLEIESGRMFLVMEYVDGKDFGRIMAESAPLSMASVLQIARSCASAVDYAHGCDVVHRDLKPKNLMLSNDGVLKIVDFGIARSLKNPQWREDVEFIECTPIYSSPEQCRNEAPTPAADIYALGAILFEMLSGKPIYPPDSTPETIVTTPPNWVSDIVPPPVLEVMKKAVAPDPQARWPSAGIFYEKLAEAAAPALQGETSHP